MRVYSAAKAVFEFGAALIEPEGGDLRPPTDLTKLRALGWAPRSRRSHKPMPALNWKRAPELLAGLESRPEPIARLMTFLLATASRAGAGRMARRRNIDLKAKTWANLIEDLKDGAHRNEPFIVALSDLALSAIPSGRGEYVFTDLHGRPFTGQNILDFVRKLRRLIRIGSTPSQVDRSPPTACVRCFAPGPRRPGKTANWSSSRRATLSTERSRALTSETLSMSCAPN